jgi:tripartite-type tricarboxylate transporter receptor subunit TctC
VPTTAEVGYPKIDATSWFGVFAPAATPKAIIDKLSAEIAIVVQSPAFKQKAIDLGSSADYMNPKQYTDYVIAELKKWSAVVKSANIEAE